MGERETQRERERERERDGGRSAERAQVKGRNDCGTSDTCLSWNYSLIKGAFLASGVIFRAYNIMYDVHYSSVCE